MNKGGTLGATAVDVSAVYGSKHYWSGGAGACGQVQPPHGQVHVLVGMGFSDFSKTALDPLFWLHHCNCDRIWEAWRAKGGTRTNPTSDKAWTGQTFTFFDENGKAVTMTDCDVVNTAQQLKYVYEGVPTVLPEGCPSLIAHVRGPAPILQLPIHIPQLVAGPVRVPLGIPPQELQRLVSLAGNTANSLYLQLSEITAPTQPGLVWATFVGPPSTPSGAVLAGSELANPQDPSYVGTVALFAVGVQDEMGGSAQFAFPLNRALLAARNAQSLEMTFVPQGVLLNGSIVRPQLKAKVSIGKATIIMETETPGNAKAQ
jgi:tyrosinase